jgi:hypothetical protein
MMRSKAFVAALMTLVCLQLGSMPLLARPTRSIVRPNAGRLIVSQSTASNTRERPARKNAASRTSAAPVRSHAATRATANEPRISNTRLHRRGASSERNLASDSETARVHAWIRTRTLDQPDEKSSSHTPLHADTREEPQHIHIVHASAERGIRPTRASRRAERLAASAQQHVSASRLSIASNEPFASVTDAPLNRANTLRPAPARTPHSSIDEIATTPLLMPSLRVSSLYDSRGRLVVPPPLYGSHENLLHQNEMANHDGLDRIRDDADLLDLRRQQKLVPLPENDALRVDASLPENRRFSRPWTATFLSVLARDYYATFHQPLQVDSAVRTVAVQQRLTHSNGNAAPSTGDTASPHLTGQAVDIAKHGLSITQIAWMRTYLQPLIGEGKIDVEEEFQQACFHISVYRNYVPSTATPFTLATTR